MRIKEGSATDIPWLCLKDTQGLKSPFISTEKGCAENLQDAGEVGWLPGTLTEGVCQVADAGQDKKGKKGEKRLYSPFSA